MISRAKRLQRLLAIRSICEERERTHLQSVLASVKEAECALGEQQTAIEDSTEASAIALQNGSGDEWLFAGAQIEIAGWNRACLAPILNERQAETAPAMSAFLECRREHEQVRQLIQSGRSREQLAEERRAQAATDDWFLVRMVRERR